jgi:RNA polymerase sigma-70 factor (ECF subfamily)
VRGFLRVDVAPDYENLADPGATPEQRAMLGRLYRVLDELPVELRVAWVLRRAEGEQLESVAKLCSCSLATAKRRIDRAQALIERAFCDDPVS